MTTSSVSPIVRSNDCLDYFSHTAYWDPLWRTTDKNGARWQAWYELARKYYVEHGNLLVPHNYTVGNRKLGRWIERQRAAYNGKMACGITRDHVIALNRIGMVWQLETRTPWDEWYDLAESYFNKEGALCVTKAYIFKGKALGEWVCEQRKKYKSNKLTEKQISALERIGMVWQLGKERCSWEQNFQAAAAYFAKYGHLNIPADYKTELGTNLCQWVRMQRDTYHGKRSGALSEEQINRLNSIGMIWSAYDAAWERMYAVAVRYYQQHGNLQVSQRYLTEQGERLGQWISVQRQSVNKKCISGTLAVRINRLNQIGMVWNVCARTHQASHNTMPSMLRIG